ncbi:L-carnitine/gamma-butyrobetaine antiporter [Oligella ureolytica]
MKPFKQTSINPPVFFPAAALILILVGSAAFAPSFTQQIFGSIQGWILTHVSWFYVLTVAIILISTVFLAISRYGDIKLVPDHSVPDFKDYTWFAMLFSTGMGIGLMFFGVAEPVMHFLSPPIGEGGTVTAARNAMSITFFHWGLHAWAILRHCRIGAGFFLLPTWPPAQTKLCTLSNAWRANSWPPWLRRRCLCRDWYGVWCGYHPWFWRRANQ